MESQTALTKPSFTTFIKKERDLLILIIAFIFSVLGYTVYWDFNAIGFTASATGLLNALMPSKNRPEDERMIYIKYIAGFYSFAICTLGLFVTWFSIKLAHMPVTLGRSPLYFIHASLFIYTLMYAVIRRLR